MKTRIIFLLAAVLALFSAAQASELPHLTRDDTMIYGGTDAMQKASGDTILLMGPGNSGAPYIGDFEDGWNGWTSTDLTQPTETHWHVSDYRQSVPGNLAAWCGTLAYPSCVDSLDAAGGYGNSWVDILEFRQAISNPTISTLIGVTATLQYDTEPGYDYVYLEYQTEGQIGSTPVQSWDGEGTTFVDQNLTFLPGEYVDGTDVRIQWRVTTDGGWSDEDCLWPTAGACQVDDINVTLDNGGVITTSQTDFQDGTLGDWVPVSPVGVGDFARRWVGLTDIDPCATNFSYQVAFIDDGITVPGTGGSECVNFCYGPGGYIVTTVGGLAGPANHIHNEIRSPIMAWPDANFDGIRYAFDVMVHEDLSFDSPGIFFTWAVRSATSVEAMASAPWQDTSFVFYGGPDYRRFDNDVTGFMAPGHSYVQVNFAVYEIGWVWGFGGNDGYPAPYFDNAAVRVFPIQGPSMSTRELELAQDNFPAVDAIDFNNPASMHVRFDMANNISPMGHQRNDPGDSITINVVAARTGASLVGLPQMHYTMQSNSLFDEYRTAPTSGMVLGVPVINSYGLPIPDKFAFDLPDTGLLFPGDVLHYYFRAEDDQAGDIRAATLPADITGFGDFSDPLAYNTSFVVHALPTVTADGFGGHTVPPVLFWNDFAGRGGEAEWYHALRNLGLVAGVDYDIYYTNAPSSGVGNGLGGRTSGLALEHYSDLLYSSGDLQSFTISSGFDAYGWSGPDAGNDVEALVTWLSFGGKDMFLTGDSVASDLAFTQGTSGQALVETVMGVDVVADNIRPFIGDQTTPLVFASAGHPVFSTVDQWVAYGGCRQINTFDAVTVRGGATRLAEFSDPAGVPGGYIYAAATLNYHNTTNRIISLPYDLSYVYDMAGSKSTAPLAARTQVLGAALSFMSVSSQPHNAAPVPEAKVFAVANHPNPFNPATRIDYRIRKAGPLTLKVFNIRGQLVRTLIDRDVTSDGYVMWDGTTDSGGAVASGVYFYEARSGGDVKIGKMALVK